MSTGRDFPCRLTQTDSHILLTTDALTLGVERRTGGLAYLSRPGDEPVIGRGATPAAAPNVRLDGRWLDASPRYRSHTVEETPDGVALAVTLTLGPLTLTDRFHLTGSLVERTVRIAAPGDAPRRQLHGLRMTLPGVGIGPPAECRFEAPACAVRPCLPLAVAARQSPERPGDDPRFAPGARSRWQTAINDCPDVTPGLMVVHNPRRAQSLLAWYVSRVEAATALVGGDGRFPDLIHQPALAAWLTPGASVTGGTQYILLHEGDYPAALDAYRALYPRTGIEPPLYGEPPAWTRHAAIYEVHPGQFGGFRGLTARLPALAQMGITVLYLMPVMEFDNRHRAAGRPDQPWDENWLGGGSPYAIRDFESLEPSLGTEADFRQLVQTAHAHGMRVLLDFVPQGCALDARYVTEHPDWFCRDEAGNMVHSHGWIDTWSFDWANPDYQAYMLDWSLRQVRDRGVDGYRIDAPHGKEPNWAAGLPYHASATNLGVVSLLERLQTGLKALKPDAVLLCELFGPLFARSHDLLYDYYPMVMGYELLDGRLTPREYGEWLSDYWRVMPAAPRRVCFTETHDTRSHHPPAYKLRGSLAERALFGILIAAGFVPMIWAGQERGLEDFYRGMLAARRRSRALQEGERLCNAVSCREAIAERDYRAHEHVFSLLRRTPDETVWGLVSLYPEVTPFTFGLPVERLGLRPEARYRLRDLATGEVFSEYGRTEWRGAELANITLTPRMFRPYLWRIEKFAGV